MVNAGTCRGQTNTATVLCTISVSGSLPTHRLPALPSTPCTVDSYEDAAGIGNKSRRQHDAKTKTMTTSKHCSVHDDHSTHDDAEALLRA